MTTLTASPGYRWVYIVSQETYYANRSERPEINIVKQSDDARGCDYEFCIVEHAGIGIKVGVFDDAWRAFTEAAPLFTALAEEQPASLAGLRLLLDEMGVQDVTEREKV